MSDIENEESVVLRLHNLQEKVKKLEFVVGYLENTVLVLEKRIYQLEMNKHE